MLGIGGALHQNSSLHPPPADTHSQNVRRLISLGSDNKTKDDDDRSNREPSSSKSKKRKREESLKKLEEMEKEDKKRPSSWIPMVDVISQGKKKLQSAEKKNGVTFAFIGS